MLLVMAEVDLRLLSRLQKETKKQIQTIGGHRLGHGRAAAK